MLRLWKAKLNDAGKYDYVELVNEAQFKKIVSFIGFLGHYYHPLTN